MAEFVEKIRYEADVDDVKRKLRSIDQSHSESASSAETMSGRMRGAWDKVTSSVGDTLVQIGKIAAAASAAAAGVAAAAIGKGFADALNAQDNTAMIEARLGVSPERAAELGRVASTAYRDAWGESLAETTAIVTGLESSFEGLGDADLERLTGRAAALGQAFELDVNQGIQTASELLESGLASSAEQAFDLLTRGLQEMPQGIRDELLAASQEYGDFFGDLGLSGDVAFRKLTEYAEGGIYGIDKFGDSLKELTIRGTDMSATSVKAYEAAGLSADEMAKRFLAGGDQAREAVEMTAAGLLGIEDPVERANAAIALFGTPLEDLSTAEIPGFLAGLTDLSTGLDGVDGAAQSMADSLGGTTSAKLEAFKRKALGALADFAAEELIPRFDQFVVWFEENWPAISAKGEEVLGRIREVAGAVFDWFETNWPAIRDTLLDVWEGYVAYWHAVVEPVFRKVLEVAGEVVGWVQENWPQIRTTFQAVFDWLANEAWPVVQQVIEWIRGEFDALVAWTKEHWPEIQHTIEGVVETVQVVIEDTVAVIKDLWSRFGDDIVEYTAVAWDNVKNQLEAAFGVIRGIIDTVMALIRGDWGDAWEGLKLIVTSALDGIKGQIDAALDTVRFVIEAGWEEVAGVFESAWNGITGFFSGVWTDITGFVSDGVDEIVDTFTGLPSAIAGKVSGAFDSVWTSFKAVINRVIDAWNGLKLPGFTIGGWDPPGPGPSFPSIDIPSVGVPRIPRLAQGGLAFGPLIAMIGDNPGARTDPEIVTPTSHMEETFARVLARADFGRKVTIEHLTVETQDTPREWFDEGLWRVAG